MGYRRTVPPPGQGILSIVTSKPTPAPVVVVLAAGHGTRMRSPLPKVLHPICGLPMVGWPVRAALAAGAHRVVVVSGPGAQPAEHLPEGTVLATQPEALGTGDAVRCAAEHLDADRPVVILAGDVPLITAETIAELVDAHASTDAAATMLTMRLADPSGYGRVVRDERGDVLRVVETKEPGDATEHELAIDEVNTGVLCFDGDALAQALHGLRPDNAQGELYLPDVLPLLRAAGRRVGAHETADPAVGLGVNDQVDLAEVRAIAQRRIIDAHLRAGVTVIDPARTVIDVDVRIGAGTVVDPGCQLEGATVLGRDCRVGPQTTMRDAHLGDGVTVLHSVLQKCRVDDAATVGPFAYLRPAAHLRARAKAGTFVEIKNSDIGEGAKVPHLSYVGDADVGTATNLGAGTITANYDGVNKHRTRIGAGVRGAIHTGLVAPVAVGDGAVMAAGSTITEDVPAGALAVARARQRNVEGYAARSEKGRDGDAA
jgi:bifunctional UDP-N-acetylglucosamine pyrophosphorylase/glucosamine-1-phosphate N-acetyltransferase